LGLRIADLKLQIELRKELVSMLHPKILIKDGKKQFAVLPYEEFVAIQGRLANAGDLLTLRQAKWADRQKSSLTLAEVKRELGMKSGR
jgi:hypothetical protein